MDTASQELNRNRRLKSIMKECRAPACEKVRALSILLNEGNSSNLMQSTGRNRTHYYRVLKDPAQSLPLARDIAAALGVELCDLWPDRTLESDFRIPQPAKNGHPNDETQIPETVNSHA